MYCASYFSGEKSHWWCNGFNIFSRIKQDTVGVKGSKTMAALLYRQSCVWTNPLAVKLGGGELMFVLQPQDPGTLQTPLCLLSVPWDSEHSAQTGQWFTSIKFKSATDKEKNQGGATPQSKSRPPPAAAGPQESCALITTHKAPWNEGIL